MYRNKNVISFGLAAVAIGSSTILSGCFNSQEPVSTSSVESISNKSVNYEREAIKLKEIDGINQEKAFGELQGKYGITPQTQLPENPLGPLFAVKAKNNQQNNRPVDSEIETLKKTAGDIHSGLYDVKRVYIETIYMAAGATIERYTSNLSGGADPIAVLWRYTNQTSDFKTTGTVDFTAQHMNVMYAWNDDAPGLGLNSKVTFTSNDAGYYAFMVFAYQSGATGTATLTKRYKPAGGSWSQSTENISITGTIVRYSGPNRAPTFMAGTDTYSTGSDPWIFFWDFGNMRGGDNDDRWNDARTSWVYNGSWYPASSSNNSKNCVLFTGYSTGGTATYSFYE